MKILFLFKGRIWLMTGIIMAGIIIFYSPPFSFSEQLPASEAEVSTGSKGEKLISMDLQDAPLKQILKIFSQQAGVNFVASENIQDKKVTILLDKVTIEDALNTILGANGFTLEKQPNTNIYIVKNSSISAVALKTKIYKLSYATVSGAGVGEGTSAGTEGIEKIIKNLLSLNGKLIVDSRTNSLIVTDASSSLEEIDKVLNELDVKTPQVMISAEIMEVSTDTLKRLGVEWGDSTGQLMTTGGGKISTFFPLNKNRVTGATPTNTMGALDFSSFAAVIRAIKTDTSTHFLAKPRLLTLNNRTAEMKITKNAAVSTTTITISQGGSPVTTTALERYDVGTTLKVTPHINKDDYITLTIEPEVSRVAASAFGSGNFDPLKRSSKTSIMVKDGETIVIAGLISREDSDANRKVPVLGDIPIIGRAFNRDYDTRSDSEVLVFITTKIIKEDGSALANVMQQELGIDIAMAAPRKESLKGFRSLAREQDSPMSGKELMMEKEVLKVKSSAVAAAH